MVEKLDQILQDCLLLLDQGSTVEECIAMYPEDAEELELLLHTALTARSELTQDMPLVARTRVRARVLAEWDRRHEPRQRRWTVPFFLPRWAAVAASVVMAIVVGGTGTVAAAGGAIPGELLYPVKELTEEARLWMTRSPEAKVAMYTNLVRERVGELKELTAKGRTDRNGIALERLERHIADSDQVVEETIGNLRDSSSEVESDLQEQLQETIAKQQSSERTLRETLEQAPAEARPGLEHALETIQRGRERVRSALEATLGRK